MLKRPAVKVSLGIISSVLIMAIMFYFFLFVNPLGIHEATKLKWIPIVICIVSLYISGKINSVTSIKWLPLLFAPFIVFDLFNFTYFPFIVVLIVVGILMLVATRNSQDKKYKLLAWGGACSILLYFLLAQPLILVKGDYTYDDNGNMTNVNVIWDLTDDTPLKLPSHVLLDIKKQSFDMIDIKGKTHFITFWATWCAPCIEDQPQLEKLKEELKGRSDVEFIDISFDDEDMVRWLAYLKKKNPQGIQLISKSMHETSREFDFSGIPMHFVVNAEGEYKKYKPFVAAEKALRKALRE